MLNKIYSTLLTIYFNNNLGGRSAFRILRLLRGLLWNMGIMEKGSPKPDEFSFLSCLWPTA